MAKSKTSQEKAIVHSMFVKKKTKKIKAKEYPQMKQQNHKDETGKRASC